MFSPLPKVRVRRHHFRSIDDGRMAATFGPDDVTERRTVALVPAVGTVTLLMLTGAQQ
jgi:hypothetical protein